MWAALPSPGLSTPGCVTHQAARKPDAPLRADGGHAVHWLNELEWVDGLVWANVWMTDCVAQVGRPVHLLDGQWRGSTLLQSPSESPAASPACRGRGPNASRAPTPRAISSQVDPASGAVVGWVRFGGLRERALQAAATDAQASGQGQLAQREQPEVLNGIAWDERGRRLFVTGKQLCWLRAASRRSLKTSHPSYGPQHARCLRRTCRCCRLPACPPASPPPTAARRPLQASSGRASTRLSWRRCRRAKRAKPWRQHGTSVYPGAIYEAFSETELCAVAAIGTPCMHICPAIACWRGCMASKARVRGVQALHAGKWAATGAAGRSTAPSALHAGHRAPGMPMCGRTGDSICTAAGFVGANLVQHAVGAGSHRLSRPGSGCSPGGGTQ